MDQDNKLESIIVLAHMVAIFYVMYLLATGIATVEDKDND